MMKKTLGTALMALFTLSAQGYSNNSTSPHCCGCAPNFGTGPYVGAGIGWNALSHEQNTNFFPRADNPDNLPEQNVFSGNGIHGLLEEAFLGYGYRNNSFFLGAELFANNNNSLWRQKSIGLSTSGGAVFSGSTHDLQKTLYGARIRPGYFLSCNSLFYVPIGYVRTHWAEANPTADNNPEFSKETHGYQIGWGLEQAISQNVSLRFGYLYNKFKDFTIDNLQVDASATRFREYKTYNDQAVLDLSYQFGCPARPVQPTCPSFGNGFYVGIQGGRSILQDTWHQDLVDLPNTGDSAESLSESQNRGQGGFGQVFVGYGRSFCNFYLGAEVFAEEQSAKWKATFELLNTDVFDLPTDSGFSHFDVKRGYGISLVPGYFISCNTLLYAKVGAKNSREEFAFAETDYPDLAAKKDKGAFLVGLGMQTSLGCHLSLRTEFTSSHYSNFDFEFVGEADLDPDTVGPLEKETHKARVNQFSLGLVYTFM